MKSNILKHRDAVTDVIIPTYNNPVQLGECIGSIVRTSLAQPVRVIVVNNGAHEVGGILGVDDRYVKIVNAGKNLGWEGGLNEGLKHSTSEYVVFSNDDIYIPRSEIFWLRTLIRDMEAIPSLAAIGPTTNVAMGQQNIWAEPFNEACFVNFLIGFFMLVRRSALDAVGGIDESLPGGDDIDLSIRFRKSGYNIACRKDVFIFHHGFQTGQKIYGGPEVAGGWNSPQMTERTNTALIKKHGFLEWWETLVAGKTNYTKETETVSAMTTESLETAAITEQLIPGNVLELGCGALKTVPHSVGVDLIPKGEESSVDFVGNKSVADIVADVQEELPIERESYTNVIARHVLEHMIDPIKAIANWIKVLKKGGRLIICVPDERLNDWIIVHPDHYHAFTPKSLRTLMDIFGMKPVGGFQHYNNVSFTMAFEK